MNRQLTAAERADIKNLVTKMCANYSNTYKECLPLDCACFMLSKHWTGGFCKYFNNAVLPLNPALAGALTDSVKTRPCAVCGAEFVVCRNKVYCSAACAKLARKKRQRDYMQKRRHKC